MKTISVFLIAGLLCCVNMLSAQHLKKDGTPDMRYKENKSTYSSPYSSPTYTLPSSTPNYYNSTSHLKKDGTPDRRYKEYKPYSYSTAKSYNSSTHFNNKTIYNYSLQRDADGKIERSEAAKLAFMKQTHYPNGRPGYVVDHIIPLYRGGCDCPSNMQWQTIADAKAKDKWE
jgi:hypothetical protein